MAKIETIIQRADCMVCGRQWPPYFTPGSTRFWSALDDHAPVHVECERRAYPSHPGTPRRRAFERESRPKPRTCACGRVLGRGDYRRCAACDLRFAAGRPWWKRVGRSLLGAVRW